jgi:hypothetical protein
LFLVLIEPSAGLIEEEEEADAKGVIVRFVSFKSMARQSRPKTIDDVID